MRSFLMAAAVLAIFVLTASAADTTQPSEQAKGTVTGKVLHDGKAMPGMRIAVMDAQAMRRDRKKNGAAEKGSDTAKIFGKGDRPKPVAQTVSASDGSFTLDVPAGHYVIVAAGKKIGMAHERVEVKAGESAKVELQLQDRGGHKKGKHSTEPTAATQPS